MLKLMYFYYKHIYAIIGTIVFHIILIGVLLLQNLSEARPHNDESEMIIDMELLKKVVEEIEEPEQKDRVEATSSAQMTNRVSRFSDKSETTSFSEKRSNNKDPFFDDEFRKEMADAEALVNDVSKQLGKKTKSVQEYAMPEETTDGMKPEDIPNTIYSGESNIQYDLKNRYHLRMPIPVYLAKAGGKVVVNIWVNTSGKVVKTEIKSIENAKDPLLAEYALQAAERTVFNKDNSAPNPQRGTISYIFVAQ